MRNLALIGVLAVVAFLAGLYSQGPEDVSAQFFAWYVSIPTRPDNSNVTLNDDWHDGTALDWDADNVGDPVYARGWGYQPGATPTVKASSYAFNLASGDCHVVWWHVKDVATGVVLGHVREFHTWNARSFTIYWYFTNQNYFNCAVWIASTANDSQSVSCDWTGPHVHETHATGSAGTWGINFNRFDGEAMQPFNNKIFLNWTRKVVW